MFTDIVLCVVGIALLVYSANKLVDAASNFALNLGVSKMAIGLTIVAVGTSLPEFVVSINSSLKGNPSISIGNVVGSNIANIALIIGITALILPINSIKEMVRREVPIMIALSALVLLFAQTDSKITFFEGIILIVVFVLYILISFLIGKHEKLLNEEFTDEANRLVFNRLRKTSEKTNENAESSENSDGKAAETTTNVTTSIGKNLLFIFAGIVGLIIGSEALVRGAIRMALALGVSEEVIGLTLVAIGTSLPELATSVMAARKGQPALSVGTVLGSNIFNITAVMGLSAIVPYLSNSSFSQFLYVSPDMVKIHIPVMLIVAVILLPIMLTNMKISRYEGAFLLVIYLSYSIMLAQSVMSHKVENAKLIQEQIIVTPDSVAVE